MLRQMTQMSECCDLDRQALHLRTEPPFPLIATEPAPKPRSLQDVAPADRSGILKFQIERARARLRLHDRAPCASGQSWSELSCKNDADCGALAVPGCALSPRRAAPASHSRAG